MSLSDREKRELSTLRHETKTTLGIYFWAAVHASWFNWLFFAALSYLGFDPSFGLTDAGAIGLRALVFFAALFCFVPLLSTNVGRRHKELEAKAKRDD